MALTRAGSERPTVSQSREAHAPAATTTAAASIRPDDVSTPTTRLGVATIRVTGVHSRIRAPRARARRPSPATTSTGLAYPLSGS